MLYRLLFMIALMGSSVVSAQTYYPKANGKLITYENDVKIEGYVSKHHANGKFVYSVQGTLPNGMYGWRPIKIAFYKDGILNGAYTEYEENGDTIITGKYRSGRRIEEWRGYTNGVRTSVAHYNDFGEAIGWQFQYSPGGALVKKEFYSTGTAHYQWTYGAHERIYTRGNYDGENKQGEWLWYDTLVIINSPQDTLPVMTCSYKDGNRDGAEREYNRGVLISEHSYSDDLLHGVQKEFVNEKVVVEENYTNGLKNGTFRRFALNQQLIAEEHYVAGKENGEWHHYDSTNGQVTYVANFETGVLINRKEINAKNITVIEQKLVERDSLVYTVNEYYDNGANKSAGRLIGARRTGTYQSWHSNGKKNVTASFRNDRYYGVTEVWNDKGVRVFRSKCANGRDTMPEEVWSDAGVKLVFGTLAYERQRSKYIPTDLVPHYEDLYVMGDIMADYVPPRGPWEDWEMQISIGGHFIGNDQHTVPRFPGGSEAERDYFGKRLMYPDYEMAEHITGKNVITFTVRADGSITAVDVARSLSPGLDAAACKAVREMPNWEPAKIDGVNREGRCWMEFEWSIVELKNYKEK